MKNNEVFVISNPNPSRVRSFYQQFRELIDSIPSGDDLIAVKSISIPGNFAYRCSDCDSIFNYRYTKSCPSCGSNHSTHASLAYHKQAQPVKPL